jgi:membrane protein
VLIAVPERFFETSRPGWYAGVAVLLVSLAISFVVSLGLYTVVPVARPRWGQVWKGSLVAAVLFVLLGQLFPLYLQVTGSFSAFGATFAFILIMLLWFYLLGQIIVIGAEVNALLGTRGAAPH